MEEGFVRSKFKRVCVFCGSNSGNREVFSDAAIELGNELVSVALLCRTLLLYSSMAQSLITYMFLYTAYLTFTNMGLECFTELVFFGTEHMNAFY